MINTKIRTSKGIGEISKIYITELGYIMVKVFYPKKEPGLTIVFVK